VTKAEFLAYAEEALGPESMECLYEQMAQYESECALYGDAGVGMGLHLQESIAKARKIDAQYTRLTGRSLIGNVSLAVRGPSYYERHDYSDPDCGYRGSF
jgi:hypothetical protein